MRHVQAPRGKRICHSKLLLTSPSASTLDQVTVATACLLNASPRLPALAFIPLHSPLSSPRSLQGLRQLHTPASTLSVTQGRATALYLCRWIPLGPPPPPSTLAALPLNLLFLLPRTPLLPSAQNSSPSFPPGRGSGLHLGSPVSEPRAPGPTGHATSCDHPVTLWHTIHLLFAVSCLSPPQECRLCPLLYPWCLGELLARYLWNRSSVFVYRMKLLNE